MAKNPKSRNQLELPVLAPIVRLSADRKQREAEAPEAFVSSILPAHEASSVDLEIFRSIADSYFRSSKK